MKKITALLLCMVMLAVSLTSCIRTTSDYKGVEIPIFLSDPVYNLDPAFAYLDDGATKLISLLFEGLYVLDEDGKPVEAMAEGYETYTDRDGNFICEFQLADTKWNDGRSVNANDFVFAWKRLLQPDFESPAAALLYDIKNARDCKTGEKSIDALGVSAVGTKTLQVMFEKEIDIEQFIEVTASPALVPLRDDKVSRLDNWATSYITMATNGPFYVKIYETSDNVMTLERNVHYFRNAEKAVFLDSKVKPFRLLVYFNAPEYLTNNANDDDDYYADVNLAFSSNIARSGEIEDANVLPTLNTHTYIFNTTKAPFDNADVRKALSMALDRDKIVEMITYAEAAEGFIPEGVFDTKNGDSFRENGGSLISSKADLEGAKALAEGATTKSFTITVRTGDLTALAVANYAAEAWAELGFEVSVVEKGYIEKDQLEYVQYQDLFYEAYKTGDFDVIAVDQEMLTAYAFGNLAPYAKEFSGMIDVENDYAAKPHYSGFDNEEYNKLIASAYEAKDASKRSELLHQAEEMLVELMPAIPVFVYQNAYVRSKDLTSLDSTYFGAVTFTKAKLANEENYTVVIPE